jgi:N-acetylmuramoyl-L-alanine amidase
MPTRAPPPAPAGAAAPALREAPPPAFTPTPGIYANVLIDPGHGGDDYGAEVESMDLNEKTINMTIAMRLYNLLKQDSGKVRVGMTRYDETTVSRPDRVAMANASYDFFISIHCNTSSVAAASGISTYYHTHEGIDAPFASKELAEAIQEGAVRATGARDRGIVYDDQLYILNHTTIPAALIEAGYLTNPDELRLLLDDSYVGAIAEGLRQGILEMADRVIAAKRNL